MAEAGKIIGKVLIQIGNEAPREVGTIEIPVNTNTTEHGVAFHPVLGTTMSTP